MLLATVLCNTFLIMTCSPSAASSPADHLPALPQTHRTPAPRLPDSGLCTSWPGSRPAAVMVCLHRPADKTSSTSPRLQPTARPRPPTHYRYHRSAARTAAGGGCCCGPQRAAALDPTAQQPQPQRVPCRTRERRQTQKPRPCGSAHRAVRRLAVARGRWLCAGRVRSCPRRRRGPTSCLPGPAGGPQLACNCACWV